MKKETYRTVYVVVNSHAQQQLLNDIVANINSDQYSAAGEYEHFKHKNYDISFEKVVSNETVKNGLRLAYYCDQIEKFAVFKLTFKLNENKVKYERLIY